MRRVEHMSEIAVINYPGTGHVHKLAPEDEMPADRLTEFIDRMKYEWVRPR
jgi:hypothetical protein